MFSIEHLLLIQTEDESTKTTEHQSYCHCTQNPRCSCERKTYNKSDTQGQYKQQDDICRDPCDCKPLNEEEYYRNRIDEEVVNWLNAIPVQNNESQGKKRRREAMVKALAETLKWLPDDNDFEDNARVAIKTCIEEMPMWYPSTKKDEEQIKKQCLENLFDRITKISRKPDFLRDVVRQFIDSINFKDDVDKKVIIDNFVNKLKLFAVNAPKDDAAFNDLLIYEVTEMLEKLPIQFRGSKSVILNTLAKKLVEDIEDLLKDKNIFVGEENLKDKFKEIINKWFDEVGEISDNLPNSEERKIIINDLALVVYDLQSRGVDDVTMNKMERRLGNIFEDLDIPLEVSDDLTDNLMDKLTDVIYAKDRDKIDGIIKQETFKELNNWLDNVPGINKLSTVEQYKLVKEIAKNIADTNINDRQNKQEIVGKISKYNIDIDPASVDTPLDEITNRLKSLPEKIKKDDLVANIQEDFNYTIDKSYVPESMKTDLKNEAGKVIAENIEASSLATKINIEDMKEMLLKKMYDTIKCLPETIQTDLKNKFDDSIDKHIHKIESDRHKDTVRHMLLKEINYIIDKDPIPDEEKSDIKYNIKHILNENFDQPFSYQVKDHIKNNIRHIVGDRLISREEKDNLINKLTNIVEKTLDSLPKQSMKEYLKDKTLRDTNKVIDKSSIPEHVKHNIKQKLKTMLHDNFDQPFSAETKDAILENITDIVEDCDLSRSFKEDLIRKLTKTAAENLDELPEQTIIDYTKECVVNDIDEYLEKNFLTKKQLSDLKKQLELSLTEFLDRPYTRDQRNKLNETLDRIITESDIPSDEKEIIKQKLIKMTGKKLDRLPYQTPEEFAKDTIVRDITHVLDDLSLTANEKTVLTNQFEYLIEEGLHEGYLGERRAAIKEGIVNIIRESSAPRRKQDDFIFKSLHAVSKILDESYYDDYEREQLQEFYDMIDKAPMHTAKKNLLKPKTKRIVDDHTLDPEYENVKDMIKEAINLVEVPSTLSFSVIDDIDETIIEDVVNAIRTAPLSNKKKSILEFKVNMLVEELNQHGDINKILKELEEIVEEIPLPSHDKAILKSKLDMIVPKDSCERSDQLKYTLIRDLGSAVDLISLGKDKNSDLKSKIEVVVSLLDEPVSGNVKDKLKEGIFKILDKDVYSKDKKNLLKDKITSIVDKLPTHIQDKNLLSERLLTHIGNIIDETPIRQHIKKDIESQIRNVITESSKQTFNKKIRNKMKTDIDNIINEAPITEYQKKDLRYKVMKVLDQVPAVGADKDTISGYIDSILEGEALSKVKKSELKKKIHEHLHDFDELTPSEAKAEKIKGILKTIDDTVMSKDKKSNIKAKLENILTKPLETLPSFLEPKDNLLNELKSSVHKVLDDALIPRNTKVYLKNRMRNALSHATQQPPVSNLEELEELIKNEISNIMDDVDLSQAEKDILKNSLANTVSEVIGKSCAKSEQSVLRDNVLHQIDAMLDNIHVPKGRKKELQFNLQTLFDKILEEPVSSNTHNLLDKEINKILAEMPISREKKAEIRNKLSNLVEDCVKSLPMLDYKKNEQATTVQTDVIDNIYSIIDQLQLNSSQKENLTHQLQDIIIVNFRKPPNNNTLQNMRDDIDDVISEAPISRSMQTDIRKKLSNMLDIKFKLMPGRNISIESKGSKKVEYKIPSHDKRDDVQEADSKIGRYPSVTDLKNSLAHRWQEKADRDLKKTFTEDAYDDSHKSVQQASVINEIDSIFDQFEINHHQKDKLKQELKSIVNANVEIGKPIKSDTIRVIKNKINDIVTKVPISIRKKTELKEQLYDMVEKELQVLPVNGASAESYDEGAKVKSTKTKASGSDHIKSSDERIDAMQEVSSVVDQVQVPDKSKKFKGKADQKISAKEPTNMPTKYKPVIDVKVAITEEIASILDQVSIDNFVKNNLKQQLNNVIDDSLRKPIDMDTLQVIKNNMSNIISEAPIPRDKKAKLRKEMAMVDSKLESLTVELPGISGDTGIPSAISKTVTKYTFQQNHSQVASQPGMDNTISEMGSVMSPWQVPNEFKILRDKKKETRRNLTDMVDNRRTSHERQTVLDIKAELAEYIESIVDKLNINDYQKDNLKKKLYVMVGNNLEKPLDNNTVQVIKSKINEIFSKAPIHRDVKNETRNQLIDIVEGKIESQPGKSTDYEYQLPSKVNEEDTEGIDSIVDSLEVNSYQKDNLKHNLNKMVGENLKRPLDNKIMQIIQNKINHIVSEIPISSHKRIETSKKLANMIANKANSRPNKDPSFRYHPAPDTGAEAAEDMDAIKNKTKTDNFEKDSSQKEVSDMVNGNLENPVDKYARQTIKNRMNNIADEAPIYSHKKKEIKMLPDMVEKKLEPRPAKTTSYEVQPALDIKTEVTKDIDSIIDELQINSSQKDNLKQHLYNMVDDILGTPVSSNTMQIIKNKINEIVAEAPVPSKEKMEIRKKIASKLESLPRKSIERLTPDSDIKAGVTQGIDSFINELDINHYQKDKLKQQLNNMLYESLQKPINNDTLSTIKKNINDIISVAPIPRDKKNDIKYKLFGIVDSNMKSVIVKKNGVDSQTPLQIDTERHQPKIISLSEINNIMQDIDSTIDQIQIPNNQKKALKHKLSDKVGRIPKTPFTVDSLRLVKDDINNIISKAPISKEKKAEMRNKILNIVDDNLKVSPTVGSTGQFQPLDKQMYNTNEIMLELDSNLDHIQIPSSEKNKIRRNIKDMIDENSQKPLQVIKEGISKIIAQSAIPGSKKAEIINKLSDAVEYENIILGADSGAMDKEIRHKKHPKSANYSDYSKHDTGSEIVFIKEKALRSINGLLQNLQIPNNEKLNLISKINDKLAEHSERPMPLDNLQVMKEDIDNIIAKSAMTEEQKMNLKKKLYAEIYENIVTMPDMGKDENKKEISYENDTNNIHSY